MQQINHRRLALHHEILPMPGARTRWTPYRKMELLRAIGSGQISTAQACADYSLSVEEIGQWSEDSSAGGARALRVTKGYMRARRLAEAGSVG